MIGKAIISNLEQRGGENKEGHLAKEGGTLGK
jgi:hypothetical protein